MTFATKDERFGPGILDGVGVIKHPFDGPRVDKISRIFDFPEPVSYVNRLCRRVLTRAS